MAYITEQKQSGASAITWLIVGALILVGGYVVFRTGLFTRTKNALGNAKTALTAVPNASATPTPTAKPTATPTATPKPTPTPVATAKPTPISTPYTAATATPQPAGTSPDSKLPTTGPALNVFIAALAACVIAFFTYGSTLRRRLRKSVQQIHIL